MLLSTMAIFEQYAADIAVLDSVHINLDDMDEFSHHCQQGKNYGFDGKTLIHPKQIEPTNRIFGLSEGDVEQALQVIEAFETATKEGKGAVTLNGKLIERMHVTEAERILKQKEYIDKLEDNCN